MKIKKLTIFQGYIFLMILVLLLSVFTGSSFFYFILILLFINLLTMYFIVLKNSTKIMQYLSISNDEVCVGETFKVEFKTSNIGILPISHAKINCVIYNKHKSMEFPADNIFFNPYQIISIKEKFIITKRGIYTDGKIFTEYFDPLKIFSKSILYEKQISLIVYPKIVELDYFHIPSTGNIGTRKISNSTYEDYSSIKKIRKYSVGDSMKKVHWKLSSKKGELFVKEFDSISTSKTLVIADAFKEHYLDDSERVLEDKVVDVAAAILKYSLKINIETVFLYNSDRMVQVESRDLGNFNEFLKELVTFIAEGTLPFNELVANETKKFGQGSFVTLITPIVTDKLLNTIMGLSRRRYIVSLIIVNDESLFDKNSIVLESIGVKIYKVKLLDDIKKILEGASD